MARMKHNASGDPGEDSCARCGHARKKHTASQADALCEGRIHDPFGGPTIACECPGFVESRKKPAPASTQIKTRARWMGDPPKVGEYLMSQGSATRFAYRIISIDVTKASGRDARQILDILADKIPCKEVPAGATVHPWKWDARGKKTAEGTTW